MAFNDFARGQVFVMRKSCEVWKVGGIVPTYNQTVTTSEASSSHLKMSMLYVVNSNSQFSQKLVVGFPFYVVVPSLKVFVCCLFYLTFKGFKIKTIF